MQHILFFNTARKHMNTEKVIFKLTSTSMTCPKYRKIGTVFSFFEKKRYRFVSKQDEHWVAALTQRLPFENKTFPLWKWSRDRHWWRYGKYMTMHFSVFRSTIQYVPKKNGTRINNYVFIKNNITVLYHNNCEVCDDRQRIQKNSNNS